MKSIILTFSLLFFSFASLASNKICVGENIIVVFNKSLKKLLVHDKASLEILQSTVLEGYTFGEFALSKNESNIWFEMDGKMYCKDVKTGEMVKEIPGMNVYKFELSNAQDYLIHFEKGEYETLVNVYDLNTAKAISHANITYTDFIETCHFDPIKKELHLLSSTFESKTEQRSKEPQFGLPETPEEIHLAMLHDEKESRYFIYDLAAKKVTYNEVIFYSSGFSVDFEVINDRLFVVTQVGTAEIKTDHTFGMTSLVATNLPDYGIFGDEIFGGNSFFFFRYSIADGSFTEYYDDEVNQILIDADGIAVTETDYYAINEGIFYRFNRATPLNVDMEIATD